MSVSFWTDSRIDALREHFDEGLSFGQISAKLGCSRSAVAAKLHRLGLKRGKNHLVFETAARVKRKPAVPGVASRRAKRRAVATAVPIKPRPAPPAPVARPASDPVPFKDLAAGQCRWPLGTDPGPAMACCGAPVIDRYARSGRREATHCAFHLQAGSRS